MKWHNSIQLQRKHICCIFGLIFGTFLYITAITSFNPERSIEVIVTLPRSDISDNKNTICINNNSTLCNIADRFLSAESNETIRKIYSCYHKDHINFDVDLLEDIQLSKRQPKNDTTIFFVITTCFTDNLVEIRRRQACAIESAARHNPDRDVFVVFASPVGFGGDTSSGFSDRLNHVSTIIKTISIFPNVHLRNANLKTFMHGTPMEQLERKGSVYRSQWPPIHLSDVLRLLVLYRYGGIYMDSDVIVMRSFRDLNPVFLTEEEKSFLNNGVMGTTHDGFGHEFFHEMIGEGASQYNATNWGTIGRDMIMGYLRRKCQMVKYTDDNAACPEMKIYSQYNFHPFGECDDAGVWNKTVTNTTLIDRIKSSYSIHLWSSRSFVNKLNHDDKTVVNVVAAKHCPKIYNLDSTFDY